MGVDVVKRALTSLVLERGRSIKDDSRLLKALLNDVLKGEESAACRVVVAAAELKLVTALPPTLTTADAEALAHRLALEGFHEALSQAAIDAWLTALDIPVYAHPPRFVPPAPPPTSSRPAPAPSRGFGVLFLMLFLAASTYGLGMRYDWFTRPAVVKGTLVKKAKHKRSKPPKPPKPTKAAVVIDEDAP